MSLFGWTPDIFWHSTPHEFMAALEMYREAHDPEAHKGQTTRELAEIFG